MAISNKKKKENQREKNEAMGITVKDFPVTEGTWLHIQAQCEKYGYSDWRELLTVMVHNVAAGAYKLPKREALSKAFIEKYMP